MSSNKKIPSNKIKLNGLEFKTIENDTIVSFDELIRKLGREDYDRLIDFIDDKYSTKQGIYLDDLEEFMENYY